MYLDSKYNFKKKNLIKLFKNFDKTDTANDWQYYCSFTLSKQSCLIKIEISFPLHCRVSIPVLDFSGSPLVLD